MEFHPDDFVFAGQYLAFIILESKAPLRSRERAFYAHQLDAFSAEANRRMKTRAPATSVA